MAALLYLTLLYRKKHGMTMGKMEAGNVVKENI